MGKGKRVIRSRLRRIRDEEGRTIRTAIDHEIDRMDWAGEWQTPEPVGKIVATVCLCGVHLDGTFRCSRCRKNPPTSIIPWPEYHGERNKSAIYEMMFDRGRIGADRMIESHVVKSRKQRGGESEDDLAEHERWWGG